MYIITNYHPHPITGQLHTADGGHSTSSHCHCCSAVCGPFYPELRSRPARAGRSDDHSTGKCSHLVWFCALTDAPLRLLQRNRSMYLRVPAYIFSRHLTSPLFYISEQFEWWNKLYLKPIHLTFLKGSQSSNVFVEAEDRKLISVLFNCLFP